MAKTVCDGMKKYLIEVGSSSVKTVTPFLEDIGVLGRVDMGPKLYYWRSVLETGERATIEVWLFPNRLFAVYRFLAASGFRRYKIKALNLKKNSPPRRVSPVAPYRKPIRPKPKRKR